MWRWWEAATPASPPQPCRPPRALLLRRWDATSRAAVPRAQSPPLFPPTPDRGPPGPQAGRRASLNEVLQARLKTPLSDEYVRGSYRNLMGFGMTLLKWKREQRRAEAEGPRDQEGDSVPAGYRVARAVIWRASTATRAGRFRRRKPSK